MIKLRPLLPLKEWVSFDKLSDREKIINRKVDADYLEKSHKNITSNLGRYQSEFKDNLIIVDNETTFDEPMLSKKINRFLNKPINHIAQKWIKNYSYKNSIYMRQMAKDKDFPYKQMVAEAYPTNFSMEEFNSIKSYRGKIKYAAERLRRLGAGSSRIVYQIDKTKVLKLAKNAKGLAQNEVETDGYLANMDITAEVFDYDNKHDEPYWIEMELAIPLNRNKKKFEELAGISENKLFQILMFASNNHGSLPPGIEDEPYGELIMEIVDMAMNMDMPLPGDFARTSSWGVVFRDGKPKLVLIDFGFTNSVRAAYYAR